MNTYKKRGFTLIELLISICIISIVFNLSLPSFQNLINKSKLTSEVNQLKQVLQLSKTTAITQFKIVTLCPTNDGLTCSDDWSHGYMAFIDDNQDRQFNNFDQILYQSNKLEADLRLRWRPFGIKTSLQWLQTGITNHQNGTFEYCYKNDPKLSRGLFVSKAGRIRHSKDLNNDGIHENASGKNINCLS